MTGAVSARCWQGERVTSSPTVITQSRRAGRHRRVQRQVHVRTVRVERTVASGLIRDSDHMNWPSHQPLRTAKEHLHEDCSFWCLRGKAFCRASGRSRTRGEGCLSFEQITSGQPSSAGEANFYDVDALTNLIDEFDAVEHQACRISPWLDVQEQLRQGRSLLSCRCATILSRTLTRHRSPCFPCLAPDLISRSTTIQVPHFGQVTQEQRMRSAMVKL